MKINGNPSRELSTAEQSTQVARRLNGERGGGEGGVDESPAKSTKRRTFSSKKRRKKRERTKQKKFREEEKNEQEKENGGAFAPEPRSDGAPHNCKRRKLIDQFDDERRDERRIVF